MPPAPSSPPPPPAPPVSRRVALITGAGSGIGRAISLALAQEGYFLALVGRRADALAQTLDAARDGRDARDTGMLIPADVSDPARASAAVHRCIDEAGVLDVLVCNAGLGTLAPIAQTSMDLVEQTMRINALAPAAMVLAAWPAFTAQHAAGRASACVVHISSMACIDPFPGFFAYASSKAAMSMQAASIAKEGGAIGVRAFALAPGAVETSMLRAAFDEQAISTADTLPPEAVAKVVMACVRGERDADNGRVIPVL